MYTPTLTGTTTQTAKNGVFKFSDITFTAKPGESYSKLDVNYFIGLSFSTTGIDSTKPSNSAYLASTSTTSTALAVTISLRSWVAGESYTTTGAWIQCKGPDYYSLSTQNTPGNCLSWQKSKMYCYGGSNVGPQPGFWRSSTTSDNFISWLYSAAWLGYVSPSNNNLGEWYTGYQGILCADCVVGFSRTGSYEWAKCPNPVWNVIRLILVFIAIIIGITFMIRSTLAGALQKKNVQSVYIKLLMNHIQLLVLTSTFNLKWPSRVEDLFNTSKPVAEVSTQILSVDWFLDQRNNGKENIIEIYYMKMMMYALIPIVMAVFWYVVWSLIYCFKKKVSEGQKSGRITASLIIMFFLIHPSIVQCMFSNFE